MAPRRYFEEEAIEKMLSDARLVVFDVNGLILDDEPLQIAAANSALERYGLHLDEPTWLGRCFGRRSSEYFSEIMRESGRGEAPDLVKELVAHKDRRYRDLLGQSLHERAFPGALTLIRNWRELGETLLALATSASREELQSAMGASGLGVLDMFDCVVCGEDVAKGNPNPETYMRVAERTDVVPRSALVFEDSDIGVRAAVGAGMPVVAVPNKFTASQGFTGARMVITDLTPHAKTIIPGGFHE
jgi:HAD superfamily hydrolase (TIGR01509 family)